MFRLSKGYNIVTTLLKPLALRIPSGPLQSHASSSPSHPCVESGRQSRSSVVGPGARALAQHGSFGVSLVFPDARTRQVASYLAASRITSLKQAEEMRPKGCQRASLAWGYQCCFPCFCFLLLLLNQLDLALQQVCLNETIPHTCEMVDLSSHEILMNNIQLSRMHPIWVATAL